MTTPFKTLLKATEQPSKVRGQFMTIAEHRIAERCSPAAMTKVVEALDRIKRLAGEILIPVSPHTSPMGRAAVIIDEVNALCRLLDGAPQN